LGQLGTLRFLFEYGMPSRHVSEQSIATDGISGREPGSLPVKRLIPSETLVERAYQIILDAICDGTLRTGERLTQAEVASRLDVSRQPVGQALAMLKAQGFLVEAGRRGLSVAPVDSKLFESIYQMRSVVEPLAARLATPQLSEEFVWRGRALVAHGRKMVRANNRKGALQADIDFHSLIYEGSGNPLIAETMQLHWQHLRRAMGEVARTPGLSTRVWREHGAILEEMVRGDPDAASTLMHDHIINAYEWICSGEPVAWSADRHGVPAPLLARPATERTAPNVRGLD
jgi:DNA-binding GntR family transcriptional regulator